MDETRWCPVESREGRSLLDGAAADTLKVWDDIWGPKVKIPALTPGKPAVKGDVLAVSESGCVNTHYKTGKAATVRVHGDLEGSGFFVSKDGLIATAAHLVPAENNTVLIDDSQGNRFAARVKIEDVANDVAILKVIDDRYEPTNFTALPLRVEPLTFQEPVAALGHPRQWPDVYISLGTSNRKLSIHEKAATREWKAATEIDLIESHVEPSSSGGAVIDHRGQAVGVVVGRYTDRTDRALVVPSKAIKSAIDSARLKILEENGFLSRDNRDDLAQRTLSAHPTIKDNSNNYYANSESQPLKTALSTWGTVQASAAALGAAAAVAAKFPTYLMRISPRL